MAWDVRGDGQIWYVLKSRLFIGAKLKFAWNSCLLGFVTNIAQDLGRGLVSVYSGASGKTPIVPVEDLLATVDSYFGNFHNWAKDKHWLLRWSMKKMTEMFREFVVKSLPGTKDVALDDFVAHLAGKQLDEFFFDLTEDYGGRPNRVLWYFWFATALSYAGVSAL